MDVERIVRLVTEKAGTAPDVIDEARLGDFTRFLQNKETREYLTRCLSPVAYGASGVNVNSLRDLEEENLREAAPGMYLFPHGYLVVATSIGGNAICFHSPSSGVYWADHSGFYDDGLSYEDEATGAWHDLRLSEENIRKAVKPLSDRIEPFLLRLLTDDLTAELDRLDH